MRGQRRHWCFAWGSGLDGEAFLKSRAVEAPSESTMSMKRLQTHVPIRDSLIELLVGLQLDESLGSDAAPEWARGTSVEEIFQALRVVGDAQCSERQGDVRSHGPVGGRGTSKAWL
jgi:hypothetical protein